MTEVNLLLQCNTGHVILSNSASTYSVVGECLGSIQSPLHQLHQYWFTGKCKMVTYNSMGQRTESILKSSQAMNPGSQKRSLAVLLLASGRRQMIGLISRNSTTTAIVNFSFALLFLVWACCDTLVCFLIVFQKCFSQQQNQ